MAKRTKVTIRDIARMCNVSISTVSKALNNRSDISEQKREEILKAVRSTGYIPSAAGRMMGSKQEIAAIPTQIIELVVREYHMSAQFFAMMVGRLINEAAGMGYRVITSVLNKGTRESRADGVVLLPRMKWESDLPVVTYDYLSDDPAVPGVIPDYESGVYEAVTAALQRGYTNPVLLLSDKEEGPRSYFTMMPAGFKKALRECGYDNPVNHIYGKDIIYFGLGYKAGMELFNKKRNRPDLIFCNDDAAIGIYKAASEAGLSIPDDLGIIGSNGIPVGHYLVPALSTISHDYSRLAREVLDRMIAAINGGNVKEPQLVIPTKVELKGSIRL